mgnify:CR=1 FL=1
MGQAVGGSGYILAPRTTLTSSNVALSGSDVQVPPWPVAVQWKSFGRGIVMWISGHGCDSGRLAHEVGMLKNKADAVVS